MHRSKSTARLVIKSLARSKNDSQIMRPRNFADDGQMEFPRGIDPQGFLPPKGYGQAPALLPKANQAWASRII
jgi:hypothetical protein